MKHALMIALSGLAITALPLHAAETALDVESECRSISESDLSGCSCQGRYFASRFLWPDETDPRYTVISTAAKALTVKPGARPALSAGEAADIIYAMLSPELFLVLTRDRAWPADKWERWTYDTLCSQLLIRR